MFNARNDHDRSKFCEDLREAILEMDEMESLRIEAEMDKKRMSSSSSSRISRVPKSPTASTCGPSSSANKDASSANKDASSASSADQLNGRDKADNRDSGVVDMDHSGSVFQHFCLKKITFIFKDNSSINKLQNN